MVATISPEPRLQFFANDGSFLVGGKLYTYAAGTTTPLATYTTSTGLIANTNPVILDSRGEASVWLTSAKYKFVLKTAADVEVWTQDQLQGYASADGTNAYGTWPISITGNAATATLATTATTATTATSVTGGYVSKIIAGTNVTIAPTSGVGDVTINMVGANVGTVTSVSGAGTSGFTLTGGPITSSGTLTVTPPAPSTSGNVLTSDGTNWTSAAPAGTTLNAIGSYAMGFYAGTGGLSAGATIAASSLNYGGAYVATCGSFAQLGSGGPPGTGGMSGTWRVMGIFPGSAIGQAISLVVRIA
jgi:hypothetical protein